MAKQTARRKKSPFAPIEDASRRSATGEMIIVVDDEDRENEGDLTIAAEKVTPEAINFMAQHGRGLICMPMTEERLDELDMPLMVDRRTPPVSRPRSACRSKRRAVTSTGISAGDRAATVLAAIDPGPGRPTWRGPVTCSRCRRGTAASSSAPGRRKRRSISRVSPACIRPASSAKS